MNKELFPTLYLDLARKTIMYPTKKKVYIGELKVLREDP